VAALAVMASASAQVPIGQAPVKSELPPPRITAMSSAPPIIAIGWEDVVATSEVNATTQIGSAGSGPLHDKVYQELRDFNPEYPRWQLWGGGAKDPNLGNAEVLPPANGVSHWDFSKIDPGFITFVNTVQGHQFLVDLEVTPDWMYKPNPAIAASTLGPLARVHTKRELAVKPQEFADYYARVVSWWEKGGFMDEFGKWHPSGHHFKIPYWEVLNEIEFEHHWTPQEYTKFYDSVTAAMRKVDPNIKFVALALAAPSKHPEMFEYFLNPANHRKGAPLDFISYHFYASPSPDQTLDDWQYTFFDQAEGFLNTVRYVEQIRKRLSPSTKTDLDELGVILPEDGKEIRQPGYVAKPEPQNYWNLDGAMYAYIYEETAKMGIDVLGESQLVGYPSQYPSVSMMNYNTAEPNPRFWVLKLLKDHFGPGDKLVDTTNPNESLSVQAFETKQGKSLLVINKRNRAEQITLPAEADGAAISLVAPSTGDHAPAQETLHGRILSLQPFEVAVLQYK